MMRVLRAADDVRVTITSSAAAFDVRIDLVGSLDRAPPVERHWIEPIPGQLL